MAVTQLATRKGAQIIHTTTGFANGLAAENAAKYLRMPWIYEIRGSESLTWLSSRNSAEAESSEYYLGLKQQELAVARRADHLLVISEIVKEQLLAEGIPTRKITVVPNAIDDDLLSKEVDKNGIRDRLANEIGISWNMCSVWIGCIGSIVGYEGLEIAIEAILKLPRSFGLVIVGDGEALADLRALALATGASGRIWFVGGQDQSRVWEWYAALDVFAIPRLDRQVCRVVTPIKAMQALALRIPIVASDLPAIREVTGGHAVYVPPEKPESLAKAIMTMLDDEIATKSRVNAGQQWVSQRTWSENARRIKQVYSEAIRDYHNG